MAEIIVREVERNIDNGYNPKPLGGYLLEIVPPVALTQEAVERTFVEGSIRLMGESEGASRPTLFDEAVLLGSTDDRTVIYMNASYKSMRKIYKGKLATDVMRHTAVSLATDLLDLMGVDVPSDNVRTPSTRIESPLL